MLGLPGRRRHCGLLAAEQRIDGRRLADVGVADQADGVAVLSIEVTRVVWASRLYIMAVQIT